MPYRDREALLSWRRKSNKVKRYKLIQELGGECVKCGEDDVRVLDFDHINDNGAEHRKANKTVNSLDLVEKDLQQFQLLCKNCNWLKELERRKKKVKERTDAIQEQVAA